MRSVDIHRLKLRLPISKLTHNTQLIASNVIISKINHAAYFAIQFSSRRRYSSKVGRILTSVSATLQMCRLENTIEIPV